MKKFLNWAAPALMASMLFVGCQKDIKEAGSLRDDTKMLSSHCPACVNTWAGTVQTIPLANNFQAIVKHDQTKYYIRIERTSGTFGNIRVATPGVAADAPNTNQGTNIGYDPATTSHPAGTGTFLEFNLPPNWTGCQEITFSFQAGGLGGGGTYPTGPISYYLRKLCTVTTLTPASSTICVDATQTLTATVSAQEAFAGGTLTIEESDGNGGWTATSASVAVTSDVKSVTLDVTSAVEETRTFRAVYSGTGQYNTSTSSDATVTFENCGCPDEFNVLLQCAGALPSPSEVYNTVSISFTASEAGDYVIQGGLNANAVIYDAGTFSAKFTRNTTHSSVVNGQASVTRWEGSLDACETVTIQVQFTGGTSIGSWSAKKKDGDDTPLGGESGTKSCN